MSRAVSLLSLALGLIAVLLASQALIESTRSLRLVGRRRFGLALSAFGATTAVHYFVLGVSGSGPASDAAGPQLAALLLTLLPVGVFCWLRVEAYLDGPGDRIVDGTPGWIAVLPSMAAGAAGAVLISAWRNPPPAGSGAGVAAQWLGILPSILLVATFSAIGWSLIRGQQTRHAVLGGWSASGLAVTLIFPTGAVVYATQALTVRPTLTSSLVDWLGVPAAVWFWRECRRLTGAVERQASRPVVTVPAQRSQRPAPWAPNSR